MAPPVVFLIGLMLDLLGFLPLGVGEVTMLTTHGIAQRLRRFLSRQGFTVVWLIFIAVAGAYQFQLIVSDATAPSLPVTLTGYGLVDVTSADVGSTAATITSETAGSLSLNVPLSLSLGSQPITLSASAP